MTRWVELSNEPDFPTILKFSPGPLPRYNPKPLGELSAEEYLAHARADLVGGDSRALINAFGNAKRSIHYQIDRLLYRYCLYDWAKEHRVSFPKRLEVLAELRLLPAPKVLGFYNRVRNIVEHEYVLPTKGAVNDSVQTVEETLELSELLLLATERPLHDTPRSMLLRTTESTNEIEVILEPGASYIRVGSKSFPLSLDQKPSWLELLRAFSLASRTRFAVYSGGGSVIYG